MFQDIFGSKEPGESAQASPKAKAAKSHDKKKKSLKHRAKGSRKEGDSAKQTGVEGTGKDSSKGNGKGIGNGLRVLATNVVDPWAISSDEDTAAAGVAPSTAPGKTAGTALAAAQSAELEPIVVQQVTSFDDDTMSLEQERKQSVEFQRDSVGTAQAHGMVEAAKMLEVDVPAETARQSQMRVSRLKAAMTGSGKQRGNFLKAPTGKLFSAVGRGATSVAGVASFAAGAVMGAGQAATVTADDTAWSGAKKKKSVKKSVVGW
mmetsp:Transcript_182/g.299  ORF Transcript_182/g.299 Transcript_182/m.299 type:complete len:262 (-) Transcript_182:25-810(-)